MTWGFVTCGPNEALVISGGYFLEICVLTPAKGVKALSS